MSKSEKVYRRIKTAFQVLVITLVSCSVICVGGLIWLDNSIAIIPGKDSTAKVWVELTDDNRSKNLLWNLCSEDQGSEAPNGTILVQGNGDRDDNRVRSFKLPPFFGQSITVPVKFAASDFPERRTVRAYRDFGHLKLMPEIKAQHSKVINLHNQRPSA